MKIDFKDKALRILYEEGVSKDKNIRKLNQSVIRAFFKVIQAFVNAKDLDEYIRNNKGAHYERLQGKLKDLESVRLNNQYRLLFQSSAAGNEIIITQIYVIEISKHYD